MKKLLITILPLILVHTSVQANGGSDSSRFGAETVLGTIISSDTTATASTYKLSVPFGPGSPNCPDGRLLKVYAPFDGRSSLLIMALEISVANEIQISARGTCESGSSSIMKVQSIHREFPQEE